MSKIALYRKYRPTSFDELYGQEHVAKTLKNSVAAGNFSHAYLFYGPRGTGKTSAARILAKAINCQSNKEGNPDNVCEKCTEINADKTVDIIEIDAASHTQVDNIREVVIEKANLSPTSLKYKVYIIDEAHMLSKSSFNALLKTLEEPPKHVVFILATTEVHKIIPTIQSRCQRFDFRRVDDASLKARLLFIANQEKIEIDELALDMIVRASEGGFRDAISLLDQANDLSRGKISREALEDVLGLANFSSVEDYVYALIAKDAKQALEIYQKALDGGYEPSQFYKNTLEVLRRLLFASLSEVQNTPANIASEKFFNEVLPKTNPASLVSMIETLISTESAFKYSSLPQLPLEVATAKIILGNPIIVDEKRSEKTSINQPSTDDLTKVAPATKNVAANSNAKWQQFLMEVKGKNTSVHAVLRVCEANFNGNEVCLTFPYKFHKERIEDLKNLELIEATLTKVYGDKFKVRCVLSPSINKEVGDTKIVHAKDDLLDEALEIFGGEVIS